MKVIFMLLAFALGIYILSVLGPYLIIGLLVLALMKFGLNILAKMFRKA